jgi:O-antigen/teichoic acid export membrane protein
VLVFGYFLREVGDFFNSTLLIGMGSGLVGRIAVAGAVLNLALNALLIPQYGIWGAAWATFGTWAAYCLLCWVLAARQHRLPITPWPFAVMLGLSALTLWDRSLLALDGAFTNIGTDCERSEAWGTAVRLRGRFI